MPRKTRLLIVDDSRSARALVRELAEDAGYTVVGDAADGLAGVATALRLEPDIVVMDWRMPKLDGVAATAQILARRPAIVVVAFSSAIDPAVADAFRQAGAAAYVTKPNIDQLLAELARHQPSRAA